MDPDQPLFDLAAELGKALVERSLTLSTVESCTGGGMAYALTSVPGSSSFFERAFVTYSNEAKVDLVGVDSELLENFGAVSEEVALAMAEGGIRFSEADYCISVTGIAGPDGGTEDKPVGTVCLAWADMAHETVSNRMHFDGDRQSVRYQSIVHGMQGLLDLIRA